MAEEIPARDSANEKAKRKNIVRADGVKLKDGVVLDTFFLN